MDVEILAVLCIQNKLALLQKLLDRRLDRVSLDLTSPTLPLMERVYKLGECKRLCANLAVMGHRIECAMGEEAAALAAAARAGHVNTLLSKRSLIAQKKARGILRDLGVTTLEPYKALPLFAAECKRLKALYNTAKSESTPTPSAFSYIPSTAGAPASLHV